MVSNKRRATASAVTTLALAIAIKSQKKSQKKRKKRSTWVKPWLQRRKNLGVNSILLSEVRDEEANEYEKFLRMSSKFFDELLGKIGRLIEKKTVMRDALSPDIKLAHTTFSLNLY